MHNVLCFSYFWNINNRTGPKHGPNQNQSILVQFASFYAKEKMKKMYLEKIIYQQFVHFSTNSTNYSIFQNFLSCYLALYSNVSIKLSIEGLRLELYHQLRLILFCISPVNSITNKQQINKSFKYLEFPQILIPLYILYYICTFPYI